MKRHISQDDIIYFIVTDRFNDGNPDNNNNVKKNDPLGYHGGDFDGISQKIPYLKNLGITALWITPVYLGIGSLQGYESATSYGFHGYWPLDFEKVDPHLISGKDNGRMDLRRLTEDLHFNGIKLILDIVVNHSGYHTRTYHKYPHKKLKPEWFNPEIPADDLSEEEKKYKIALFGLPSLNHDLADVRDYFVNNIVDWIEDTGVDGIRMDAVPHIEKNFWYYFKSYVRGKYQDVFFLGEDLEFDEESVARYQREHDFDSLFDFPLQRNIIEVLILDEYNKPTSDRRGMGALASPRFSPKDQEGVLDADSKYNNPNRLVTLLDNHDLEKRIMSWALQKTGGERLEAAKLVKYALTFQFTTRGIPQVYYGTELCLEGDRNNGGDFMVRADMPWHIIDPVTLKPFPVYQEELEVFNHLQRLIQIRKKNQAISFGYLFTLYSDFYLYVYMREFRGNTIIVAINNGGPMTAPALIDIGSNVNIPSRIKNNLAARKRLFDLLSESNFTDYQGGTLRITMKEKEARVFRLVD